MFQGYRQETLDFLWGIRFNNDRTWFQAHKEEYLRCLYEHTAALDPATADKVLQITQEIVQKHRITTLMITHNMKDAIAYGNRLIMMYDGRILVDAAGEEKNKLTVEQLLGLFNQASGSDEADDKLLLSK